MRKFQSAFTLLELLLILGISTLIAVPAGYLIYHFFFYSRALDERLLTESQVRGSLERMVKELRKASPSDAGAYPIESAEPHSLVFFSDVDNDGSRERIRYFLDNEILKRGEVKSSGQPPTYDPNKEIITPLATFVKNGTSSIFNYFDANYSGTGSPMSFPIVVNDIRLINISLTIGLGSLSSLEQIKLNTNVMLRNLKDN